MKKTLLILTICSIAVLFACKKKDNPEPKSTVVGFWEGKYGEGSDIPNYTFAFLFRSNGTVRVYSDYTDTATSSNAEGTYIVTGSKVKTTYSYGASTSYSTIADIDAGFTAMDGTWGENANTSGKGTFRVFKK